MTDELIQAIWSWLPMAAIAIVTACAARQKDRRVFAAGVILLFDLFGCLALDRGLQRWSGFNAHYDIWASLGYASFDIASAGMLAASFGLPEAMLALLLVVSMLENVAFGLSSRWGMIDLASQTRYGWATFGISVAQAALLTWWWRDGGSGLSRVVGRCWSVVAWPLYASAYRGNDFRLGQETDRPLDGSDRHEHRRGVQEWWPDGPASFGVDRDYLLAAATECGLGEAGYLTLIDDRNRPVGNGIVLSESHGGGQRQRQQADSRRDARGSGRKPVDPREASVTLWGASLLAAFRVPHHVEASEAIKKAQGEAQRLIEAAEMVKSFKCGCCEEDSFEQSIAKVAREL